MNFFHRYFRPGFIAAFVLASFGTGIVGAHTAFTIDKHIAVSQARASASELTEKQEQLQETLSLADATVTDAAEVADDETVLEASQDLEEATAKASDAVAAAPVQVEGAETVANVTKVELPAAATSAEATAEPSPSTSAEGQPETDAPSETTASADSTAEGTTAETSADPVISPSLEVPATAAADADVVAAQEEVAKVLEGEIDDPEEARAAKQQIDAAVAEIEAAAAEVEESAEKLEDTAGTVAHQKALDEADGLVDELAEVNANVNALAPLLADQVDDPKALTAALDAQQELSDAVNAEFDRDDVDSVTQHIEAVGKARGAFDSAVDNVIASHEAWVAAENDRIDDANEKALEGYDDTYNEARAEWKAANRSAVAAHSNGWSGQPTGVSGSNGRISSSSLCEVDFAPGHVLQCDAAAALEAADAAYHADTGSHLSLTDSYRSYSSQVTTRARKGYMAAVPGTSNHGWGMAVDFDRASALWMAAHGDDFGWVHPSWAQSGGSKPEWWHLEYVAPSVGEFKAPKKPAQADHVESLFADDDEDK